MPIIDFEEFEYAKNRVPCRLYISKGFSYPGRDTVFRHGWKRFEVGPLKELVKDGDEFVLHETDTGIQQIKARFIEDGRGVTHLHIQRWSTKTGNPMGEQVVLYGEQISRLLEFLENIRRLEIPSPAKFNVNEADLRLVHMPDADARKLLEDRPDLVAEFARSKITTEDVVALAYRREQLKSFSNMLDQAEDISERNWQEFFERNQWIFGYGLSYIFTTGLDGRELQQTIRGSSLIAPGKIPDGIMKTRATVSALCLVEIKKSSTDLLKKNEYRPGTWAPSTELSGAVAQCQETLRAATDALGTHQRFTDEHGDLTGEELMSVQPRSFLVVGSLSQFQAEHGVNAARYQAFEGFRRNLRQPEILTFDELYERARFIVDHTENSGALNEDEDVGDIPF
ncbi:Shedu immune nuclease family protein [uncultured Tateyamaria sp.]|uniref:Shedu immune nuclease family protein n=1 Tax=uncultured Tateyamaria sp. TaxID=455651 RepID=UPI002628F20B|nr:Shedu immune nuclease family protein [uncultured Tateyamaria sp.]